MAVSLSKGANVSLTKEAPNLVKALVGLGWDPRATDGKEFDLDAIAFLLNTSGKVRNDADFIYFKNLKSADGSVEHTGDNRTGQGDGDDEALKVDLSRIPADVDRIVFCVIIYEGPERGQNFGQVRNAFIRIADQGNPTADIARYDLAEDASTETAMIFGELYRNGAEWKFRAVGQGYKEGFAALVRSYGVNA
jgi:Uncharacterized proteins involved in stress response, homologs of TerZ and putative cAMP-binding protein CABP1